MSEDTIRVRVERGEYRHEREHYTRGDELEVPEKTLDKHPRSLTRIEDVDDSATKADEPSSEGDTDEIDVDPHPSEVTIPELEERIADVEDVDLLEAIRDAEEASKDREGATDALDDRIADLEE